MMHLLPPQFIRMKAEWKSTVFWLILPIVLTIMVMKLIDVWQDETTVPIGVVVEEESQLVDELIEQLEETPLLRIEYVTKADGLRLLAQHELDSVYIIRSGYEDKVYANDRNRLIEAYASNRSFAYTVVKEIVTSYAQEDIARSKAAFELKFVYEQYDQADLWHYENIVERSKERQSTADLLTTSFSYGSSETTPKEQAPLFNVYGIWVLFTCISTFFLFDWVIKDQRNVMKKRWVFTNKGFHSYATILFILYTGMLFIIDFISIYMISHLFQVQLSVMAFIVFRVTINFFVLFIAQRTKQLWTYYVKGAVWTIMLGLAGGALVPIDRIVQQWPIIVQVNPVYALLTGDIPFIWTVVTLLLFIGWRWKGRRLYA